MTDRESGGDIGESIQTAPERRCPGMAATLASEEAAKLGYHAHRLAQRWRCLRRVGGAVVMAVRGLPFSLLEEYRT